MKNTISSNSASMYKVLVRNCAEVSDKTAIISCGRAYTYSELSDRINSIANKMAKQGVMTGDVVAIDCSTGVDLAASVLGVLKCGASHLLLPSDSPLQLKYRILERNNIRYAISDSITVKHNGTLFIDPSFSEAENLGASEAGHAEGLYTSILPKEFSPAFNTDFEFSEADFFRWVDFSANKLQIDASHKLVLVSPKTMLNPSLWLDTLTAKGTLTFVGETEGTLASELQSVESKTELTAICASVFDLNRYQDPLLSLIESCSSLKNIVSLGEDVFDCSQIKGVLTEKQIKWFNLFGFPEIAFISTIAADGETATFNHIGRPFVGTKCYVLNQHKQLCPINSTGDLFIETQNERQAAEDADFAKNAELGTILPVACSAQMTEKGLIKITDRKNSVFNRSNYSYSALFLKEILLSSGMIHDCFVTASQSGGYPLAYIVLLDGSRGDELNAYLQDYLPSELLPLATVFVDSFIYAADGEIDMDGTLQDAVLDSKMCTDIAREISAIKGLSNAAVKQYRTPEGMSHYHMWDVPALNSGIAKQDNNTDDNTALDLNEQAKNLPDAIVSGGILEDSDDAPCILPDLLIRAAENYPRESIHCINAQGDVELLTYKNLFQKALKIAAGLKANNVKPQDKAIIQISSLEEYFPVFWACQLMGVIAVPMGVPKFYSDNNETKALGNIWEMLDRPYIITSTAYESDIQKINTEFQVLCADALLQHEELDGYHKSKPEDIAIILFTSGSTGLPKGVTQSHQNIVRRTRSAIDFYTLTEKEVSVNWLPVEHVVGLFMFHLEQVFVGCKQVHVKSDYVLADPLRWLDLLSDHKATMSWAPNFAFGLVESLVENAGQRDWDFSRLRININAGETVTPESSKKFLRTLEKYNMPQNAMHPEWGMSETCSAVIGGEVPSHENEAVVCIKKQSLSKLLEVANEDDDYVKFVDLGRMYKGVSLRIVDKNNNMVKERIIGKLQAKGISITPGYYKNDEANNEVFVGDGWFETGDLAFMYEGGVYFAGRTKDVIIINGINYNNIEIESTLEELEGIQKSFTIACVVNDKFDDTEKLAVFYASELSNFNEVVEQIKKIKSHIMQKVGINPDYVIPISKEDIPKTSIGKLQRSKMAKQFSLGVFDAIIKKVDLKLENQNTIPAWFHAMKWKRKNIQSASRLATSGYLVIGAQTALSQALVDALENKGAQEIVKFENQPGFRKVDAHTYELDFSDKAQLKRAFDSLRSDNVHIHDVFYLGQTAAVCEQHGIDDTYGLGELLILQGILQEIMQDADEQRTLYCITEGISDLTISQKSNYCQGWLSGFLKCFAAEQAQVHPVHIDLDDTDAADQAACIINEIGQRSDQSVAYKDTLRYVPLLEKTDVLNIDSKHSALAKGGAYVVTGGLGGVGVLVSEWLIDTYNAKLLILGRKNMNSESPDVVGSTQYKNLTSLRNKTKNVLYFSGDISEADFVNECAQKASSEWGCDLDGVFHLAGVGNLNEHINNIQTHRVSAESEVYYAQTLLPKLQGAVNLHSLIKEKKDAVFVAFSSIMSLFGSSTYSAYSGSNSALDTFCDYRLQQGYKNTYCINWCSWNNLGMSEGVSMPASSGNSFEQISGSIGVKSLQIILSTTNNRLTVGLNDSSHSVQRYLAYRKPSETIIRAYYELNGKEGKDGINKQIQQQIKEYVHDKSVGIELYAVDCISLKNNEVDFAALENSVKAEVPTEMQELPVSEMENSIYALFKAVLKDKKFGVNDSFFELGGNSIQATLLLSKIQKEYCSEINHKVFYDMPTVRYIAEKITSLLDTAEAGNENSERETLVI